jgi:hypothetical protein
MRPQGVRLIPSHNLEALCDAVQQVLNAQVQRPSAVAQADETNIEAVFQLYQQLTNKG